MVIFLYETDNGFLFPVPLEDISGASLEKEMRTIMLMRWIKRQVELLNKEKFVENK